MKKYHVQLTQEQRHQMQELVNAGKAPARKLIHARVLLKADEGEHGPAWTDERISEALEVSPATIQRIRQRFIEHGLDEALNRRPQPERPDKRIIDGEREAHLIALSCSKAPEGRKRWTMRLLAEKLVQLGYVDQVSHKTVWVTLKKTNSSPG